MKKLSKKYAEPVVVIEVVDSMIDVLQAQESKIKQLSRRVGLSMLGLTAVGAYLIVKNNK